MSKPDPVAIARDLIRCPSVTPTEGGALAYLAAILGAAGFAVHRMTFSEPGAADVENLYARIGTAEPHLMFAGHTDVVPPGDAATWSHAPFAGASDRRGPGAFTRRSDLANPELRPLARELHPCRNRRAIVQQLDVDTSQRCLVVQPYRILPRAAGIP